MKLSDIMSAAGLSTYAEIGLCLFVAVFVSVAIRTLRRGDRDDFERLVSLPLGEDQRATHELLLQDLGASNDEH